MSDMTGPNPFGQRINIRHMLSTSPPPQDHVLPGLLAGTVGMLAGPGGVGKTMLELQVAMAVACGGSICGGLFENGDAAISKSRKPGRVVLVAAEESVDLIWHRLHAVVVTLSEQPQLFGVEASASALLDLWSENLHLYPLAGLPRVSLLSRDLEKTESFHQLSAACEGARLVILDPIRQFHICDENDSGAMTGLVQLFAELAAKYKPAVCFAHHVNRASTQMGQGDTAGAARGSTALSDGVRWQLNLSKPSKEAARIRGIDEDERGRFVLADIAKANYLPPQATAVLERRAGGVLVLAGNGGHASSTGKRITRRAKVQAVGAAG